MLDWSWVFKTFSVHQSDVVYMRVFLWSLASLPLLFCRGCQNSRATFSAESEARCLHLTKKERKSFGGAFQAPLARLKWRRILSEKLYLLLLSSSILLLLSSFLMLFSVLFYIPFIASTVICRFAFRLVIEPFLLSRRRMASTLSHTRPITRKTKSFCQRVRSLKLWESRSPQKG